MFGSERGRLLLLLRAVALLRGTGIVTLSGGCIHTNSGSSAIVGFDDTGIIGSGTPVKSNLFVEDGESVASDEEVVVAAVQINSSSVTAGDGCEVRWC